MEMFVKIIAPPSPKKAKKSTRKKRPRKLIPLYTRYKSLNLEERLAISVQYSDWRGQEELNKEVQYFKRVGHTDSAVLFARNIRIAAEANEKARKDTTYPLPAMSTTSPPKTPKTKPNALRPTILEDTNLKEALELLTARYWGPEFKAALPRLIAVTSDQAAAHDRTVELWSMYIQKELIPSQAAVLTQLSPEELSILYEVVLADLTTVVEDVTLVLARQRKGHGYGRKRKRNPKDLVGRRSMLKPPHIIEKEVLSEMVVATIEGHGDPMDVGGGGEKTGRRLERAEEQTGGLKDRRVRFAETLPITRDMEPHLKAVAEALGIGPGDFVESEREAEKFPV